MRRIVASIDVGTNSIKIVVGEIVKSKLNILAVSDTSSNGLKKGVIVDLEAVVSSLKVGLAKIEEMLGLKLTKAVVTVPSYNATFMLSEGMSTITSENHTVTGNDVLMALQASVYNKIDAGFELITVTPTVFRVDDEKVVRDPKGISANVIRVQSVIASAPKKYINPVIDVMKRCNIKVIDIAFTSLGDYYSARSDETDDSVGSIINFGDSTTTVSIFNKGVLTNTEVLDVGSNNIDNDIMFIYKVSKNDASDLKEKMALSHKMMANASEVSVKINKLGESVKINQYELSEVVMSRVNEILNLAKKQINLLTKKEISYIIVTGGLTEAKDFSLILETVFGHSATIGEVMEIGARNNIYSSSVGLIKYYSDRLNLKDKEFGIFSLEELEELESTGRSLNINENSILGKIFGYFFDN